MIQYLPFRRRVIYKEKFETAEAGLKEFEGVDLKDLNGQIRKLQDDLKAKDDEYAAKEADRAFNDLLSNAIKEAGGRNPKAIMALMDIDELKKSKNQSEDIKKALESLKESEAYLFGANEPFFYLLDSVAPELRRWVQILMCFMLRWGSQQRKNSNWR